MCTTAMWVDSTTFNSTHIQQKEAVQTLFGPENDQICPWNFSVKVKLEYDTHKEEHVIN